MTPLTPAACRALLDAQGVPEHIRRHSEEVARVARGLAEALSRFAQETPDPALTEAAALLHDIAKADCLQSHKDHALEGGRILRDLGHAELASLVERHVDLGPWTDDGPVTEAELLNYSDKRVRHEEVVSLADRFEDLLARYGRGNERASARIRQNWQVMVELEEKIFRRLPFGPKDVG